MKLLSIHNYYQLAGGEDEVAEREKALLERHGHTVVQYCRTNNEIKEFGVVEKALLPARMLWSSGASSEIEELIRQHKPDIAHFHNTFPLISPAAYYACRRAGVPVIQSLHNPRLMCPAASLQYKGELCERCVGRSFAWPGVLRGCYHDSKLQTAAVASMTAFHRMIGTWQNAVSKYVVFTEFYRDKFISTGLPSDRVVVKPHFVEDQGVRSGAGDYALYIGRLMTEKGIHTLLKAFEQLPDVPLKIRGDGPELSRVQQFINSNRNVELVPRLSREDLTAMIKDARFLVWPSEGLYETFGCVAAEAFACGVPVIASDCGAMKEMIAEGTGLTFRPGDSADLAEKIRFAWSNRDEVIRMGQQARREYERKYTPERNYQMMLELYESQAALAKAARN